MSDRKFKDGDRVIISQTPVDATDKVHSGKVGTVESLSHRNGDRDVYTVVLDDEDFDYSLGFYAEDLLPHNELEALRAVLAQTEAMVVSLKEAIKLKERNATELPIATVVSYKDTYGAAAMTKQADDVWLNVYPTQSGNPKTERLEDPRVTRFLRDRDDAVIQKP